jgi:hypothetical protein
MPADAGNVERGTGTDSAYSTRAHIREDAPVLSAPRVRRSAWWGLSYKCAEIPGALLKNKAEGDIMGIVIKPSDLKYKYPRDIACRDLPKFAGKPDPAPFNRDDLYEVLPMFGAVMDALGADDGRILHILEDILNNDMPRFISTREEVYDFLVETARERLGIM